MDHLEEAKKTLSEIDSTELTTSLLLGYAWTHAAIAQARSLESIALGIERMVYVDPDNPDNGSIQTITMLVP